MASLAIVKERPNVPEVVILSELGGVSDLQEEQEIVWHEQGLNLSCWR